MSTPVPIIRADGDGDKQAFRGGGVHTWKLLAEDTDGAFFLFEDVMTKGKCTPLHHHPEAAEMVYVLEGEILVNVDGVETRVGAGGMTFTPKGVPHAFLVLSDVARTLSMQTPAIGQDFYRDASEPAVDGCGRHRGHRALAGVRQGQSEGRPVHGATAVRERHRRLISSRVGEWKKNVGPYSSSDSGGRELVVGRHSK